MCKCVIVLLCIGMLGKPNFSKLSNRSFVTVAVTCKAFSYAQMFQIMKSGDMWKTATAKCHVIANEGIGQVVICFLFTFSNSSCCELVV